MTSRYENSQRLLWNMKYACFFLSLLSIAEEERERLGLAGTKVDLLDAVRHCREKGWIDGEFEVLYDCKILAWLTGRKVTKAVLQAPGVIHGNQYTIEKWLAKDGASNHFRRRYFDVYNGSRTVKEGTRMCYYVYTFKE
ncbi:MAG: hypothetical protein K6G18_06060 [Treponema sp.]|nr:hypothetical protein [Treponema sp.]